MINSAPNDYDDLKECIFKIQDKLEAFEQNISKIFHSIDSLHCKLDQLIKYKSTLSKYEQQNLRNSDKVNTDFLPIKNLNVIEEFELKLLDKQYFDENVTQMSLIIGKSSNRSGDGWNCCYELVDHFFDRKFLCDCYCFFQIVLLADPVFNLSKLQKFFCAVLRNSVQRANIINTQRISRKRFRPKKDKSNLETIEEAPNN